MFPWTYHRREHVILITLHVELEDQEVFRTEVTCKVIDDVIPSLVRCGVRLTVT